MKETKQYQQFREEFGGIWAAIEDLQSYNGSYGGFSGLPVYQPYSPQIPASNQIRNGDFAHSVNSWSDDTISSDDRNKECIFWFSHDTPVVGQELKEDFNPLTPNTCIKKSDHSQYNANYTDWDQSLGIARLNGNKTLDAPMPANLAVAGRMEEICFIAAKRHKYIEIPENSTMFAGIWDNTAGQRDWIGDGFAITAEVIGTPTGVVERKYRVYVETDKGVSYLSDEVSILAPSDASFNTSNVLLRWRQVEGVLRYIVYRYTPSVGEFLKLEEISNGGLTYIDLNTRLTEVGGYPSATFQARKAIYHTNLTELQNLAIDGVSAKWSTVGFPIVVPDQYNQGATTGKQWIRIGLTIAPNLKIENCTVYGNNIVSAPDTVFESAHVGQTVQLFDGTNSVFRIITGQSGNGLTLDGTVAWSNSNTTVRIIAGGHFGILIDLVHCCYQKGALYAPHPEDIKTRVLLPASNPNGSNQGGTGTPPLPPPSGGIGGGYDDGGIRCVTLDTPIELINLNIPIAQIKPKMQVSSGNLHPNLVNQVLDGFDYVREVYAENGAYQRCTESHRFIINEMDAKGVPLYRLRVGDHVLTKNDGKIEKSKIVFIGKLSEKKVPVRTLSLLGGQIYISGEYKSFTIWQRLKNRFSIFFGKKTKRVMFFSHNRKFDPELTPLFY